VIKRTVVILDPMGRPRKLLLFDPHAKPQSWDERMTPGECATIYSSLLVGADPNGPLKREPFCLVFSSLADAEADAQRQVALLPTVRCRIYDHQGFSQKPLREICGAQYKGEADFSPRFRRGWGSGLLFGGLALTIVDWRADFGLLWPAMFGMRMIPAGLFLLVTELIMTLDAKRKQSRVASRTQA
jgi:hypothetical protein